jgi:hypothetical protein
MRRPAAYHRVISLTVGTANTVAWECIGFLLEAMVRNHVTIQHMAGTCRFEQCDSRCSQYAVVMELQRIKMSISAVWVVAVLGVAMAVGVSGVGVAAAAAFGLLPPLALLLLWKDPAQTMSESINKARR